MFQGEHAPLPECQYITLVKLIMFPGDASFSLSRTMTLIKIIGPGTLVPSWKGKVFCFCFFFSTIFFLLM